MDALVIVCQNVFQSQIIKERTTQWGHGAGEKQVLVKIKTPSYSSTLPTTTALSPPIQKNDRGQFVMEKNLAG